MSVPLGVKLRYLGYIEASECRVSLTLTALPPVCRPYHTYSYLLVLASVALLRYASVQ